MTGYWLKWMKRIGHSQEDKDQNGETREEEGEGNVQRTYNINI
jgi:hypothetical protein